MRRERSYDDNPHFDSERRVLPSRPFLLGCLGKDCLRGDGPDEAADEGDARHRLVHPPRREALKHCLRTARNVKGVLSE